MRSSQIKSTNTSYPSAVNNKIVEAKEYNELQLDVDDLYSNISDLEVSIDADISNISASIGVAPIPVVRTNNPIIGANTINDNIDALDAAIGVDPTPVGTRTAGTIAVANSVNVNIDALDSAIGFDAQLSGTPKVVTRGLTVHQNMDRLDTYKSVETIKKTIGGIGVAGCDFNFVTAGDMAEQVINLGALIPAKARLLDVFTFTDAVFTGATTLVAETGISSSGNELIQSATIYAANAMTATANALSFTLTPSVNTLNVYLSATPGSNWSNITAGKVSIYITYINIINI